MGLDTRRREERRDDATVNVGENGQLAETKGKGDGLEGLSKRKRRERADGEEDTHLCCDGHWDPLLAWEYVTQSRGTGSELGVRE